MGVLEKITVDFASNGGNVATIVIIASLVYIVGRVIYNIFFHPMRKYPGPLICHAIEFYRIYKFMGGRLPHWVKDLHDIYGPVVRIAPNELSFIDSDAWRDIYAVKSEMKKYDKFYGFMGPKAADNILNAGFHEHVSLRAQLAPAFATRNLMQQEATLRRYSDLLIHRLVTESKGGSVELNLRDWFTYFTFDIIGYLTFGSDFGCLESSGYHLWVGALTKNLKEYRWVQLFMYLGLDKLVHLVANSTFLRAKALHEDLTMAKLKETLASDRIKSVLLDALLTLDISLSFEQLHSNMCLIIIAGSETTATLLVSIASILAEHPEHQKKVAEEVRTMFLNEDDITMNSVNNLTYLLACINESMRLFPPAALGGPRVTPKGGVMIAGNEVPGDTVVAVAQWAAYHSAEHFYKPDEFHPERWLKEKPFENDNLEVFQPFSVGTRDCIARNLAHVESRIVLARIIWNFDIKISDQSKKWREKQHTYVLWDKKNFNAILKPVR